MAGTGAIRNAHIQPSLKPACNTSLLMVKAAFPPGTGSLVPPKSLSRILTVLFTNQWLWRHGIGDAGIDAQKRSQG